MSITKNNPAQKKEKKLKLFWAGLKLDDDMDQDLTDCANDLHDGNRSQAMRQALKDYIAKWKNKKKAEG